MGRRPLKRATGPFFHLIAIRICRVNERLPPRQRRVRTYLPAVRRRRLCTASASEPPPLEMRTPWAYTTPPRVMVARTTVPLVVVVPDIGRARHFCVVR
jgi:hypothetical protein